MTSKVLTFRVPSAVYRALTKEAAEQGVSASAHMRRLLERQLDEAQLEQLRSELITKLDLISQVNTSDQAAWSEILQLSRAIASHLNPHIVSHVRAKLAQPNN
tara:strand:- start:7209 stop:7517 length:309 start_codon:yes stop_codon:yes gene_type:complete